MKEMAEGGSLLSPTFAGEPYFNKPPLYFWVGAGAFKLFAPCTYVARLLGAVPALLLLVATYHLGRRLLDARRAFVGCCVLATSSVFVRNSGEPRLDPPLVLCLVAALLAVVAGRENRRLLPLFGLAVAVGVGMKGPGGLLPLAVVGAWSLVQVRAWPWTELRLWAGLLLVPLFVAPWFLHNWALHGDAFLDAYGRDDLLETLQGVGATISPAAKYAQDLALEWWPWIPFVCHGFWRALRERVHGRDPAGSHSLLLAWCAVVAVTVLSIQQPYSRYLYPLLPATSLLAADSIVALAPDWVDRWWTRGLTALLAVATLFLAFGPMSPHSKSRPDLVTFQPYLRTQEADRPILCLGARIPRRMQGAAILYADTTVELLDAAQLRDRLAAAGRPLPVVVYRKEAPETPGLELRPLIRGDEFDLWEARLVPPR
jgi:4-amino-4-deoxy-L-arabinose transferase-like glycosyltransferase